MVDHWEGGIRVTGGALVPSKSYHFLMSFYHHNDKWHYKPMRDLPGTVTIRDTDGTRQESERLDVHEAQETLGTWIAMDGNQTDQYEALETKMLEWGNKIRSRALSNTDALLALRSRLSKSLQYPLAACTISRPRLRNLTKLLMKMVLPSLGIPMHYPRKILHAPDDMMGYQLPCLDIDAGFFQIELLLRHINGDKLTGLLCHDTLETMQLELGVGENIFELPYKKWHSVVTKCWMSGLWEFCSEYGFKIKIPGIKIPLLQEHDCFLMSTFVEASYGGEELRNLNLCRRWHRVIRLSEISTGDGTRIRKDAMSPGKAIGRNEYKWPEEFKPSPQCWKLWEIAIDKCFNDQMTRCKRLRQPLGVWLEKPQWDWWYSPSEDRLFQLSEDITYYANDNGRTRRPRYAPRGPILDMPADVRPTTCFGINGYVRHEGHRHISIWEHRESESQWWNQRILGTERRLPQFFQGVANGTAIIVCDDGTVIIVCDGSFKEDWGTAAVIAAPTLDSFAPIISVHLTPGLKKKHNPY